MGSPTSLSQYQASASYIPLNSLNTKGFGQSAANAAQSYNQSPTMQRNSAENSPPKYSPNDARSSMQNSERSAVPVTLILRRLPASMSEESLTSMLLFAEGFLEARFTQDALEDPGFQNALALFQNVEGANEARQKLHGRPNPTNDATMIVEVLGSGVNNSTRDALDGQVLHQVPSTSSTGSAQSSGNRLYRYNSTFQSMDKISPTRTTHTDYTSPDASAHQSFQFSPQGNGTFSDRAWVSGKSVINDDKADDETGELLKDPVAYAKNGQPTSQRHANHSDIPLSRFANLKLDTMDGAGAAAGSGYAQRAPRDIQSPTEFSANPMSPTGYSQFSPHLQRPHYPAANPADQNPPCNTLYVGNLPLDTSEDELKAIFSKQRGYRRLCFRTKHNGPMCFVEFEDVTFATKALNELYGQPLHNSIKGGIRLSFSKNPLGVRTGQGNNYGMQSPLTSPIGSSFGNIGAPPGFNAANGMQNLGAPPGLSPPSLGSPGGYAGGNGNGGFFGSLSPTGSSGISSQPFRNQGLQGNGQMTNGYRHGSNAGSGMPDFLLGR